MEKREVTVALVQMSMGKDEAANMKKALEMVATAAKKGAQIVVLPELFLGPYFCQRPDDKAAFATAQPVPGPATDQLADAARQHKIVLVGGSVFEKSKEGKYYNTASVFGPDGKRLGDYRKTHIPEDILYHEQHYFEPGDTGVRVFDTPYGKVSVLICYDQWYPEAARMAALKGAEIVFYPTAIGVIDEDVEDNITGDWQGMWTNAQLGHAAANCMYVCGVNRVGKEGAITFWGGSFIADPSSKLLAKGGNKEEIVMAVCDLARVKPLQKAWRFLENRRPNMYGDLTK